MDIYKTHHQVAQVFAGCAKKLGGCGSKRFIPIEHTKKVNNYNKVLNDRQKEKNRR